MHPTCVAGCTNIWEAKNGSYENSTTELLARLVKAEINQQEVDQSLWLRQASSSNPSLLTSQGKMVRRGGLEGIKGYSTSIWTCSKSYKRAWDNWESNESLLVSCVNKVLIKTKYFLRDNKIHPISTFSLLKSKIKWHLMSGC